MDHVDWVRRVNSRWIVHGNLDQTAAAYMDYLAGIDGGRLRRSCRHAHWLVHSMEPAEDPKPWFYGGLFSLATSAEAERFLAPHPFLRSVVPSGAGHQPVDQGLESTGGFTADRILRVRRALARLAMASA